MRFVLAFLFLVSLGATAQPLINNNFSYWYDPFNANKLNLKIVNAKDNVLAYYKTDTTLFSLTFERRDNYGQKSGAPISVKSQASGILNFPIPEKPWLLVAKLTDTRSGDVHSSVRVIEPNYPPDGILTVK